MERKTAYSQVLIQVASRTNLVNARHKSRAFREYKISRGDTFLIMVSFSQLIKRATRFRSAVSAMASRTMFAKVARREATSAQIRRPVCALIDRRTLATATDVTSNSSKKDTSKAPKSLGAYMLLSRLPSILPEPSALESAYYAYNAKLQRALSQPFARELYFKKGSAAETQFLAEERQRQETVSQWGKDGVAASVTSIQGGTEGLAERKTKADEEHDVRSLERSLDRTLFLVVRGGKTGSKQWSLPKADVGASSGEALHKAAKANVEQLLGADMDIWTVTNMPVGLIGREAEGAKEVSDCWQRQHRRWELIIFSSVDFTARLRHSGSHRRWVAQTCVRGHRVRMAHPRRAGEGSQRSCLVRSEGSIEQMSDLSHDPLPSSPL